MVKSIFINRSLFCLKIYQLSLHTKCVNHKNQIFIILAVLHRSVQPSSRHGACTLHNRRNFAVVASRWRHDPGFEPQTSRTDSNVFSTELTGRLKQLFAYHSPGVFHKQQLIAEKRWIEMICSHKQLKYYKYQQLLRALYCLPMENRMFFLY